MMYKFFLFLAINFGALLLGGLFTGKGVPSEWYSQLEKAPWTPPGWVFGFAWTTIMIAFAFFMMYALDDFKHKRLLLSLFILQWMFNVLWNPMFFYFHQTGLSLIVILILTLILIALFILSWKTMSWKVLLISPYIVWLIIACSLNAYIFLKN